MRAKSYLRSMILTVILSLSIVGAAKADSVSWDAGNPTTAKGQISGQGTYVFDVGWTATTVSMVAIPTGGGTGYPGSVAVTDVTKWGPIVLKDVPKGQYTVTLAMGFKNPPGTKTVYGPTSIVNVP